MKTKEEIINSNPEFLEIFGCKEDVLNQFEAFGFKSYRYDDTKNPDFPENIEILFAWYEYEDYSGDAFVLYFDKNTNKLYEVHGGHCSCYGLEDQWNPEECSLEGLAYRMRNGDNSYNGWSIPLKNFLNI